MADIAQRTIRPEPPSRPERVFELNTMGTVGDAARPLSIPERILQITAVRRLLVLAALCIAWQAYASYLNNSLLFPTLTETMEALYDAVVNGPLVERTLTSLQILLTYPFSDYAMNALKGDFFNTDVLFKLDVDSTLGNLLRSSQPIVPIPGTPGAPLPGVLGQIVRKPLLPEPRPPAGLGGLLLPLGGDR